MKTSITHASILESLRNIIPAMQASDNPESELLKRAKELNYSPAVLEYAARLINNLKANSNFQNAKSASERGATSDLIDVELLLEKYASMDPTSDDSNKCRVDALDYMISEFGDGIIDINCADEASNDVSGIDAFCVKSANYVEDSHIKNIIDKELNNYYDSHNEISDLNAKKFAAVEKINNVYEIMGILRDHLNEIENTVASHFKFSSNNNIDFGVVEYDANALYNFNDKDKFKESIDLLYNNLIDNHPEINDEYMKRASECKYLYKRNLIKDDLGLFNTLCDYHNTYTKLKYAKELLKEAELDNLKVDEEYKNKFSATTVQTIPYQNQKSQNSNNAQEILNEIKNLKLKNNNDIEYLKSLGFNIDKAFSSSLNEFENNLLTGTKFILNKYLDSDKNTKSTKQNEIDKAVEETTSEAIFNDLMYTDDILSKLSQDEQDVLTEIYSSAVKTSPDLANNKAALRSFLRSAAQVSGFDVGSMKMLSDIQKNIDQSKKI